MNKQQKEEFESYCLQIYANRDTYSRGKLIELIRDAAIDITNKPKEFKYVVTFTSGIKGGYRNSGITILASDRLITDKEEIKDAVIKKGYNSVVIGEFVILNE